MAIGNLLLGCKTFDELIALAEKGDCRRVDQYTEFIDASADFERGNSDMYSIMGLTSSFLIYAFGHAVGVDQGALKREDIARAWLKYVIADVVRGIQHVCHVHELKRVFLIGGLCDHPFVRRLLVQEFIYRMLFQMSFNEIDFYVDFDFVRPGTYLGTLGCILENITRVKVDDK
jgi:pantothenate kinase